jgi:hypothetical protein
MIKSFLNAKNACHRFSRAAKNRHNFLERKNSIA